MSCSKEPIIAEELVGEWIYEREYFSEEFPQVSKDDVSGTMDFNADNSGIWVSFESITFFNQFHLVWELNDSNDEISLFKTFSIPDLTINTERVFELIRLDEDNYTFTYRKEEFSMEDNGIEVVEFENIILTRKP